MDTSLYRKWSRQQFSTSLFRRARLSFCSRFLIMNSALEDIPEKCILLDIEGTTTPIDFVHKILFPFARERVRDYLKQNWASPELEVDLLKLHDEHARDIRQGLQPPEIENDR